MFSFRVMFCLAFLFTTTLLMSGNSAMGIGSGDINTDTLNKLIEGSTDEQKLDILLSHAEENINKNPKEAIELAKMALALASRLERFDKEAKSELILGKCYYSTGNYNFAIESIERAHAYFLEHADSLGMTETHQTLGQIFTRIGDFKKALDNTQEAFFLAGKLNLSDRIAELVRETGNIYFYFGETIIALDFYQKSLKICQENKDQDGIAKAYNNMGRIYSELENFDLALDCLKKSLLYKNKENDKLGYGNTLLNIGTVFLNKGDNDQALDYFDQSNRFFTSADNPEGIANTLYYLGKTYLQQKRYNQSQAILEEAWDLATKTNSKTMLVNISQELSYVFAFKGDFRRAYDFMLQHNELRDSVFGDEKRKLLVELDARYQIHAKQRQIELLSKEKELQASERNKIQVWIALLAIIALFFLSLTYFVYSRFRYKSRANLKLLEEITQRKLAESKLQEHQLQLEKKVEDRTRELQIAKEKAEESDKLKTAFLTNMSHEIRTPMNAIVGFSYLLTDPESSDEAKNEYIKIIRSNGEVLMNLINDILDISMIESGQLKTKLKPVAIPELLDELKIFYEQEKEKYKKHHITIMQDYDKDCDSLVISTDKTRLRQIMSNLLSNALKFTDEGRVTYGFRLSDPDEILFYVKDTGIGIDSDKHQLIFERFSKFGSLNESKLYSGTGLGLAICNELVGILGGKIWLDSMPGKGSTFYFTLPHKPVVNDVKKTIALETEISALKLSGKTILIAEDVISNYQLINAFLANADINIIWAQNGVEAVDLFAKNPKIDIILMDIQMPIMDGLKALEKIRKMDAKIPVIVNTAFYLTDEMEKSYAAGCTDYMTKPIKKEELLSKLSHYFS